MRVFRWSLVVWALAALSVARPDGASAQDEDDELGWSDAAELTAVLTGGNAESTTLGFRNELSRVWEDANLAFTVGALRTEASTITRSAVGTSSSTFQVNKTAVSALTAANYFARAQYDRELSSRTFWYTGGGWERNTFTGIDHRHTGGGGIGNIWVDNDRTAFRTAYGVAVTRQNNVVGGDETFGGLRLSYDYRQQLTPNTEFTSVLVADENLSDRGDFRTDFTNALAVNMSDMLALKVSWPLLYDREPSLAEVPFLGASGAPTVETVLAELDTVDSFLTFALVANF